MNSFRSAVRKIRCIVSVAVLLFLVVAGNGHPVRADGVNMGVANGQVVSGTVSATGLDQYTFYGGSGRYYVTIWESGGHSATTWAAFHTYNPSGTGQIGWDCDNNYNTAGSTGIFASSGTYTVKVENCLGGMVPSAAYSLQVLALNSPASSGQPAGYAGGLMQPGQTYSGTTAIGEMDVWTVQKGSTASFTLTVTKTSGGAGYCPGVDVINSNGTQSLNHSTCTSIAPVLNDGLSGTHYLVVQNSYYGNATGGYTVKVSGSGVTMPSQGKGQGSTCVPCEAAKKSVAAGGQPPAQSGGVASNGATATPP